MAPATPRIRALARSDPTHYVAKAGLWGAFEVLSPGPYRF
jgi:hypothetical protein